jgi:hypothetical protein
MAMRCEWVKVTFVFVSLTMTERAPGGAGDESKDNAGVTVFPGQMKVANAA